VKRKEERRHVGETRYRAHNRVGGKNRIEDQTAKKGDEEEGVKVTGRK